MALPEVCERCGSTGGYWVESPKGGMERCGCPRGQALAEMARIAALPPVPLAPVISSEEATLLAEMLVGIYGFSLGQATPGTGGAFVEDLGVVYATGANAGKRLQVQTGSLTQAGQYQVNNGTGVYTFYSAEATAHVLISYMYSMTNGNTYQQNNQIIGYGPQCEFFMVDTYQPITASGSTLNCLWLKAVKVHSIGNLGNKRAGYSMPEVEFTGFANTSGAVLEAFVAAG